MKLSTLYKRVEGMNDAKKLYLVIEVIIRLQVNNISSPIIPSNPHLVLNKVFLSILYSFHRMGNIPFYFDTQSLFPHFKASKECIHRD